MPLLPSDRKAPPCFGCLNNQYDYDYQGVRLTKLLNDGLELVEVLLVLALVLDLLPDTFEDADGGSVVVDLPGRTEGSLDDVNGRDEIVSEAVVQSTLKLEQVGNGREESLVASVERLERFGLVSVGTTRVEAD